MINYNLIQYLTGVFPTYNFVADNFFVNSEENCIRVRTVGGITEHWYDRTEYTVQILSRNNNYLNGIKELEDIYSELKNRFQLTLPSITLDGKLYDEIIAWQISPMQIPNSLGVDENGRYLASFNVIIITN